MYAGSQNWRRSQGWETAGKGPHLAVLHGLPSWPQCRFLNARMLQAGWCPYKITLLTKKNRVGNTGLYYLNSLKRLHTPERHSSCSRGCCGADQINESTYQTKHDDLSCTCQHRMGNIDICEIVSQGKIPLYSVTSTRDGGRDIRVEAFDPRRRWYAKTRYVAISHVWSNGLGESLAQFSAAMSIATTAEFVQRPP
jgi:hypothetical protein